MGMTQTSTAAETKTCYFCQGPATAIKQEAEFVETEQADGTVTESWTIELLPICGECNEENYDGTERHPELLPLS